MKKNVDFPKLKALSVDKENKAQKLKFVFERVENIVRKEESIADKNFGKDSETEFFFESFVKSMD